jgi:hypothetical protein
MSAGNRVKSGLYKGTIGSLNFEARLDVDGTYSQMEFSLILTNFSCHYIAHMQSVNSSKWEGDIWYRQNNKDIQVGNVIPNKLVAEYISDSTTKTLKFTYKKDNTDLWSGTIPRISDYFRPTQFEIDYEQGVEQWLTYDTNSLPRPAGVDGEELTLEKSFGRAGIEVTRSSQVNQVSSTGAGVDVRWSEQELHDAMLANWSRDEGTPWAMWVFLAKEFENDPRFVTFGIMFDTIGSFQRSGTAVFSQSIADFYSSGTPNRDAIIQRHHFRTLIHEIGHAYNLLHSWQKTFNTPWISSVVNEPGAGSFMNYPDRYPGGEDAYWRDFTFRFSDQELLFLRHAPEAFVNMGTANFGVNNTEITPTIELMQELNNLDPDRATLKLDLRVNKERPVFQYMESVALELKLTNISNQPRSVEKTILQDIGHMTIYITRNQSETKQYRSYARPCYAQEQITLQSGESLYSSIFLSAGSLGWYLADPGSYEVTVALETEREDSGDEKEIISASFSLLVLSPNIQRRREAERFAQDFFSDDVGRILAFQGSLILDSGNNILQELTERFPQINAVTHAQVALASPKLKDFKTMDFSNQKPVIKVKKAELEEASQELQKVLIDRGAKSADTLGHICFKQISDKLSQELAKQDEKKTAVAVEENILQVMSQRGVSLPNQVEAEIQSKIQSFKKLA